jgi:diguanylate cyclase
MDADTFIAWQFRPLLDAAATAMAALALYVAFDMVRRFHAIRTGKIRALWLSGAALALGTGLWSVHFVALSASPLPFPIGYGGALTAAGWALGIVASATALALGFGGPLRPWRLGGAGIVLALGAGASSLLYVLDMRIAPLPHWRPFWPGAAVLGLALLLAGCSAMASGRRSQSVAWRSVAALLGAAAVVGAHHLTVLGAVVPEVGISLHHLGTFSDTTLTVLASLGSLSLLTTLLALSTMEARMRDALRLAIERNELAARTDALTQLPNRSHFDQRLEAVARRADRDRAPIALLFISLDNFKPVNESFGRRIGDMLLQQVAARLREAVGAQGMLARVGGDEFVLLLGPEADKAAAGSLAQRLLDAIGGPIEIEGRPAPVTASIGIVLYPRDSQVSTAMVNAEAASRYAKRNGGDTFAFFEPAMLGDARDQVELLRDLRQAVARQQLELYFQPKVHAPSGEVTGAEALLRWHHPKRGMVSPAVFIPIAERHGLIGTIGQWVIDEACRQARDWRDQGLRMRVAINLSVHQLRRPDLAERIAESLRRHDVNPKLLTCEITESVAMEDAEGTMKIFEKLAAVGVQISIDDFGTGYSSLAYLRKLPAEELKIDRSFVLDLETSADARAVVDAVVKLAQALGRKVVAEGVETEAQAHILRGLGCDVLQGYLFAKPMSAKALALWAMNDVGPRSIDFRASLFQDTDVQAPLH